MSVINFLLLSLLYFWGSSTALSVGIGYYTIYRPIVTGTVAGIILGDMYLGMLTGAIVNIIYIDFVSTGGSFKGDQCFTAIMAAFAAITFDLSYIEAAAFAYPFGYMGIIVWKYRLNINSVFVKMYEKNYSAGKNPNISVYNGLLPQLTLLLISTLVTGLSVTIMMIINNVSILKIDNIKNILFIFGLIIIEISVVKIILKIKKYSGIILALSVFFTVVFHIPSRIIFVIILIIVILLAGKNRMGQDRIIAKNEGLKLNKNDLVYSWFIWMNFSHSCYSFERLQGMALAHSMKNIIKKLYSDKNTISKFIHKHSAFFNTEPNMGTPIHGYTIRLEEQLSMGYKDIDVDYIKKGMMGIAAGMGDSYTQVILTPLYITMSIMLCLDKLYKLSFIPIVILGLTIIYISYSGWIDGYYFGRESLLKRISRIKKSKIKRYFPLIFAGILGVALGKLITMNDTNIYNNLSIIFAINLVILVYVFVKKKRVQ